MLDRAKVGSNQSGWDMQKAPVGMSKRGSKPGEKPAGVFLLAVGP